MQANEPASHRKRENAVTTPPSAQAIPPPPGFVVHHVASPYLSLSPSPCPLPVNYRQGASEIEKRSATHPLIPAGSRFRHETPAPNFPGHRHTRPDKAPSHLQSLVLVLLDDLWAPASDAHTDTHSLTRAAQARLRRGLTPSGVGIIVASQLPIVTLAACSGWSAVER